MCIYFYKINIQTKKVKTRFDNQYGFLLHKNTWQTQQSLIKALIGWRTV